MGAVRLPSGYLRLAIKGRSIRFLDLICRSHELEEVFGDVVDSMLARIMHGESCLDAAQSTIQDFRALLIRERTFHVDQRRVAGLIAELLVLNRLLDRSAIGIGTRGEVRSVIVTISALATRRWK